MSMPCNLGADSQMGRAGHWPTLSLQGIRHRHMSHRLSGLADSLLIELQMRMLADLVLGGVVRMAGWP